MIRKIKRENQLKDELKEFDLVIVKDKGLRNYLQELSDVEVSTVEEELGYEDMDHNIEKRNIFLKLTNQLDCSWEEILFPLQEIIKQWENNSKLEEVNTNELREYQYSDEIIRQLRDIESYYRQLEQSKIGENQSIAIINPEQFENLEKTTFPENYSETNIFSNQKHHLSDLNSFRSASELIESIRQNLNNLSPDKTAFILEKDSEYASNLEAIFEIEGLDYHWENNLETTEETKFYLNLIEVALNSNNPGYGDINTLIEQLNDFKYSLKDLEGKEKTEFREFLNNLQHLSFGKVLEELDKYYNIETDFTSDIIKLKNLTEKTVNLDDLNDIKIYLDNFKQQKSLEKGIKLVEPSEARYTHRETVFFIGMSTKWDKEYEEMSSKKLDRRLTSFELALQSGNKQKYLVQQTRKGEKVKPTYLLVNLLDQNTTSFEELKPEKVKPQEYKDTDSFKQQRLEKSKIQKKEHLSQSELNSLVISPKVYYFDKLIIEEDRERIKLGSLLHDYAEFYVQKQDYCKEQGSKFFLKHMMEEIKETIEEERENQIRTELKIGMKNIENFIDNLDAELEFDGEIQRRDQNYFSNKLGIELQEGNTEIYFKDDELKIKGKIDLLKNGNHIYDYKTGFKKSKKKVMRSSMPKTAKEQKYPNFQPIMYLTYLRKNNPGEKLKFTFYHILENIHDDLKDKESSKISEKQTTVVYYPENFEIQILELKTFENLIRDVKKSHHRRKTLEKAGYQNYKEFFKTRKNRMKKIKNYQDAEDLGIVEELINYNKEIVGDYKYVEKGSKSLIKQLIEFRNENYFKKDLDNFEKFVETKIEELNEYLEKGFPIGNKDVQNLPNNHLLIKDN